MEHQRFERAVVARVGELGVGHVESQFAGFGHIILAVDELEPRLGIDEAAYQPCGRNPIDMDVAARHP